MLVSSVEQSDIDRETEICIDIDLFFFRFFSLIGYDKILSILRSLLVIYFI